MKIDTSLGNVALSIAGTAKASAQAALENIAAASLAYRAGASKAFGKKSGHKRDEAFSDVLGKHVASAVEEVLKPHFDGLKISTAAYVPTVSGVEQAKADVLRLAGVPEAKIRQLVPAAFAGANGAEAPATPVEEPVG